MIVLCHAVCIKTKSSLAIPLLAETCPDVHARCIVPYEERLLRLYGPLNEVYRALKELTIGRFHAFAGEGSCILNLAIGVTANNSTWSEFLVELAILRVMVGFRLFLGIEVIEIAEELVEAMCCRQILVKITKVVLAKLGAGVTQRLEQFGKRWVLVLQALIRARHPYG